MNNDTNDKVLILLSLYNGEKYIEEQLNSLFSQTVPVYILARDDGSTDHTIEIVEKYTKENNNIKLIKGENLGFVKSFNTLLMEEECDNYHWIAFCDVWLPEKLEMALNHLGPYQGDDAPVMYCSNLNLVDENLSHMGKMHKKQDRVIKSCIYVQNIATGCTMVFNHKAVKVYRKGIDISMIAHDYMMHCVCKYLGKVIYDSNSYILYRQHTQNVIGADHMTYKKGIGNIIEDLRNPKQELRVKFFKDFIEAYDAMLSHYEILFLGRFVNYKSLKNRIYILLNPMISGYEFKATLAFKMRILFGRMY